VESEEVKAKAKLLIAEQFGGPAIADQLGDKIGGYRRQLPCGQDGKGQNFMRLYKPAAAEKIMKAILSTATVTERK